MMKAKKNKLCKWAIYTRIHAQKMSVGCQGRLCIIRRRIRIITIIIIRIRYSVRNIRSLVCGWGFCEQLFLSLFSCNKLYSLIIWYPHECHLNGSNRQTEREKFNHLPMYKIVMESKGKLWSQKESKWM